MALIVETGLGLSNANSYVSAADAQAYHSDRGNALWTDGDDDAKLAALIRATSALDGIYGRRWPGYRCGTYQALAWPRYEAWDADAWPLVDVPAKIMASCCEAALVELVTPGALSVALERGGMLVSKTTGPLSMTWAANAPGGTTYPRIHQPLESIIQGRRASR